MISTRVFDQAAMSAIQDLPEWGTDAPTAPRVALVTTDFTEDKSLAFEDFAQATFVGSTPKVVTFGAQNLVVEQVTERFGIVLKEPAGGFNFICASAPGSPETITGYIVYNGDDETLYAMHRFDEDKIIAGVGDYVQLPAEFGFVPFDLFTGPQLV
jgi:hypothetical protein